MRTALSEAEREEGGRRRGGGGAYLLTETHGEIDLDRVAASPELFPLLMACFELIDQLAAGWKKDSEARGEEGKRFRYSNTVTGKKSW
jgi:hypothetical protein